MKKLLRFSLFLFLTLSLYQCEISDQIVFSNENEIRASIANDTLPIIMIHGALASGDTYARQAQRFTSNGYPDNYLYAFDWNSVAQGSQTNNLDVLVSEVLEKTGTEMVNLIGHSAGGGVAYEYLADDSRSAKVNKYIHVASFDNGGPAGSSGQVPTLNLYSPDDLIVPGMEINDVTNISIDGLDHYQIATSSPSFEAMFNFLHELSPDFAEVVQEDNITLSGRVVTLGENNVEEGVQVVIRAIDPETCLAFEEIQGTFLTDDQGFWGDFEAERNTLYEFTISNENDPSFRTIHYYREAFVRSDNFVYLRAFPGPGTTAGILLSGIPSDDNQSVVTVFSSTQAVISGRDELSVGETNLSNPALASADQTAIAFFCYDFDNDGVTSGNPIALFSIVPFLNGADIFIPTTEIKTTKVEFNGRKLYPRNWKSGSEGVSVVVFD